MQAAFGYYSLFAASCCVGIFPRFWETFRLGVRTFRLAVGRFKWEGSLYGKGSLVSLISLLPNSQSLAPWSGLTRLKDLL